MIKKRGKSNNLVAAAGILELARIEAVTAAEEVVDLSRLDVVGETGDEECVDLLLLGVGVEHGHGGRRRGRGLVGVEVVGLRKGGGLDHDGGRRWVHGGGRRRGGEGIGLGSRDGGFGVVVEARGVGLGRRVNHGLHRFFDDGRTGLLSGSTLRWNLLRKR